MVANSRGCNRPWLAVTTIAIALRQDRALVAPRNRGMALHALLLCSLLAASASLLHAAADDMCYVSDYRRESSPCDETTKQRTVTYVKQRNCTDPFPIIGSHTEPCTCTPQDYDRSFAVDTNSKCTMFYTPLDGCEGGIETSNIEVDELYCEVSQVPCTESHIRTIYAPCDYVRDHRTGQPISAMKSVEVIHFFDKTCNPYAKGSVHLPPNKHVPCDMRCLPGTFLHRDQCEQCPAGTFSTGGAISFRSFESIDPKVFTTSCRYTNVTGEHDCEGWRVDDGVLKAGPFDPPNDYFQDECAQDPIYDCHNNLKASLKMSVKLLRDGYVKFRYMVDSEKNFDGLTFTIDVAEKPNMGLKSFVYDFEEMMFNLTPGYHNMEWVFSKDEKWTKGHDLAAIDFLEVDGVRYSDTSCSPCPAGFSSPAGASECLPCDVNTYSDQGAAECTVCSPETYSLPTPRVTCLPKPACDMDRDATAVISPCSAETKKRSKGWKWLEPQICLPKPDQPLPETVEEDCPPCPSGQVPKVNGSDLICEFCPPGTARSVAIDSTSGDGEAKCERCPAGMVATKETSLHHFVMQEGKLPDGFTSFCTGKCGTKGWRVAHDHLDSGVGHGSSVEVWLEKVVNFTMDGSIQFSFIADVPQGQTRRTFNFYIDDVPMKIIEEGTYNPNQPAEMKQHMEAGPFILMAGEHKFSWVWLQVKENSTLSGPGATIFSIDIKGVSHGGAVLCDPVPAGAEVSPDGSTWVPCPKGQFSDGGGRNCTNCPAKTFNPDTFGGSWACQPCLEGTSSLEGSSECMIGNAYIPSSYCTYAPPVERFNRSDFILFDLSPLSRLHPGHMYGPVYNSPTSNNRSNERAFFLRVCDRDTTNDTCADFEGNPLNTYACEIDPSRMKTATKKHVNDLGRAVALHPLGDQPELLKRGFLMQLQGELCLETGQPMDTKVFFICDPGAGYGQPRAWTQAGLDAMLDISLSVPDWVRPDGDPIPIRTSNCDASMVWYSSFACPVCSFEDYELVEIDNCENNRYLTYKYKQPKACQANPMMPLPEDIPCQACQEADIEAIQGVCSDAKRRRNITYRWSYPKLCNENLPNSVKLPKDVVVGPCVQKVIVESDAILSPKYIAIMVVAGVLIVALLGISIVTWLKTRRMYSMYAKLADMDQIGDMTLEEDDYDDDESAMLGDVEKAQSPKGNGGS